jgi:hypothetical protein
MNRNLIGSICGQSNKGCAFRPDLLKHDRHKQFLFLVGLIIEQCVPGLGNLYCKYFDPSKPSNSTAMEIVLSKGDRCANCACRVSSGFPKPGTHCSMIRPTRNKNCLWRSCFNRSTKLSPPSMPSCKAVTQSTWT